MTQAQLRAFESLKGERMVACADVGGTKVSVALATRQGFIERLVEPTARTGANDALGQQVLRLIEQACAQAGVATDWIDQVGVSACGLFELTDGLVELATPNICGALSGSGHGQPNDWRTAVLERPLRERFDRLHVVNDGVAALMAERRWGALQDVDDCAYLSWSTGVGVGLCVDGHVLRGKGGNAGHAGHSYVNDDPDHSVCGCGNVGDVEAQGGGRSISRRFGRDAAALMSAAGAGEAQATEAVDQLCLVVGRMLYNLIVTLDLRRISIGGPVFLHHQDLLLPRLQREVIERLPALTREVALVPAGLGLRTGDFGALAVAA